MLGTDGGDVLTGTDGSEIIQGLAGNDWLLSGGGPDILEGGLGDDSYVVMWTGDDSTAVTEYEDEGHDSLWSQLANHDLFDNVEELHLFGNVAMGEYEDGHYNNRYSGNKLDNVLSLEQAHFEAGMRVRLDGGAGNDLLIGTSSGAEVTFVVDSAGDVIVGDREGDTIETSLSRTLTGVGASNLRLTGNLDTFAVGDARHNVLDGSQSAAVNRLEGGAGNDIYRIDTRDIVVEGADGGLDYIELSRGAQTPVVSQASGSEATADQPVDRFLLSSHANVEGLMLALDFGDADLVGTAGQDFLRGSGGSNRIEGLAGNDVLSSGGGNDQLYGGDGDDTLLAMGGTVLADGGSGNDNIAAVGARLQIVLAAGSGADVVQTTMSRTAAQWTAQTKAGPREILSTIHLADGTDASALRFARAGADLTVRLNGASVTVRDYFKDASSAEAVKELDAIRLPDGTWLTRDAIAAGLGRTNLQAATAGDDLLITSTTARTLAGGAGNDQIFGQANADTLDAGAGDDRVYGGDGADRLTGGTGSDVLVGGRGADTYLYSAGWGQDIIDDLQRTERSQHLGSQLQDELTLNTVQFDASVAAANLSVQRSGNDLLLTHALSGSALRIAAYFETNEGHGLFQVRFANGTVWDQAAIGRQLNVVIGTSGNDALVSLTAGADVFGLAGNDRLTGLGGADRLYGGTGNDILSGAGGNDLLDGGAGNDAMAGGLGDDTYVVDSITDTVTEAVNAGRDTVQSSVNHTLSANVEALVLTGTAALNGTGNTLVNTITGNTAANILNGGAGADAMTGGAGNDTYYVDNAGDTTVELANGGVDIVVSTVNWQLAANLENLTLTGTAAINGYGNALNNVIRGNAAANVLFGGAGADAMRGGAGGDFYYVDNVGDTTIELAGEGSDTVVSSISWKLGANVENLTLNGTAAINGTGNGAANIIRGNAAANVLSGGGGGDRLVGGLGNDTYAIGRNSGVDVIVDTDATAGNVDVLRLGASVRADQVWLRKLGDNLEVSVIGTQTRAIIEDWFLGSQHRIEEIRAADGQVLRYNKVQALLNVMDDYGVTLVGQPDLPAGYGQLKAAIDTAWV